ncbi:MAG TPA: GerAB/ArcD/ProY family transporter, partial [Bacilli bacterium]|nr:GerAB/ArcD/ProY family transporter [Bacilli bacterium]
KGKWVGRIFAFPFQLVYVAYWAFVTAIVVRTFGEVVVTAVLTNTPLEVIVGTMLLLCLLLSLYRFEVVARVNEVLLLFIVVPALGISLSSFQSARFEFIQPFWPTGHWLDIAKGTMPAMTTYLGFETMLLVNGHIERNKTLLKPQVYGVITPGVLYLLIVLAGTMAFGYEELIRQAWPTLELIKSVTVPGLILERLEAVFLGVWVAAVFTTAGNWFYSANWMVSEMFSLKRRQWSAVPLAIAIYYIAMSTGNIHELFAITDTISYLGMVVAFGLPLLFLVLAMVRKMDGRKEQQPPKEESTREAG